MSFGALNLYGATSNPGSAEVRLAPIVCLILLTVSCALASFALACATPFAAFAVLAAAMLALPSALVVMAAAWIVNQAIGFGALGYPLDTNTLAWGLGIGAAALIATAASAVSLRTFKHGNRVVALVVAFGVAYAAYEIVLLACTALLGGAGSFTLAVIARLGFLNAIWAVGLIGVAERTALILRSFRSRPITEF